MIDEMKIDRSEWGPGPWDSEPDRLEWKTETGLPGLIVRGPLGALCGYVGVPPGHPWHGRGYDELDGTVNAHGGLTYSAPCAGHICHMPAPGEPDDVWWIGFDCGHASDVSPQMEADMRKHFINRSWKNDYGQSYKTIEYVRTEVERIASQVIEANSEP